MMEQTKRVRIPERFCGPPDSGNGGYTCGLVSTALQTSAEVTLRRPIPMERDLEVEFEQRTNSIWALLRDEDGLIAEGMPMEWTQEHPISASFAEAEVAAAKSPAFYNHPFSTCFTCGPDRKPGDGLRIFPGRIMSLDKLRDMTGNAEQSRSNFFAAHWVPDEGLAGKDGAIPDEIVWAALDCPTGFAGGFPYEGKLVTGRLGANLYAPIHAGEKCVLVSWLTSSEGRKRMATCILMGESGEVKAQSRATWIKLQ